MSTTPAAASDRATARAAFDAARDGFLAAFAQAPDESLAYVPQGDEYAIGTLVPHLVEVMERYLDVFARIRQAGFAALDLAADGQYETQMARAHTQLAALRPTGADRARLLSDLQATHQHVCETLGALDETTYARQAPVIYSAGSEPFPTSFRDIMGWLIDHYHEHITQIGELLARWRGHGL